VQCTFVYSPVHVGASVPLVREWHRRRVPATRQPTAKASSWVRFNIHSLDLDPRVWHHWP
jgi:hypothetical protein